MNEPKSSGRRASRARLNREGIGELVAGLSLAPGRTGIERSTPLHPVGSGIAFERVDEVYRMDPRKIVLEGAYVRQFIEDADFLRLRAAVALERDIGQHVGVRIVGPPTDQRRVLVYGMRRWKAALAEGLERVPVRDYGPISEDKAIELQMLENEIRADPHPVDTALGFYLLSQQSDWSQKRIANVFDKNKGYVSEMIRVGEALSEVKSSVRKAFYEAPAVTVRAFQSVAQVKDVDERRAALLDLLDVKALGDGATTPGRESSGAAAGPKAAGREQAARRRTVDDAVFHVRPLRNGRSFRVRWTDDDLRDGGIELAAEFKRHFLEEYTHLLHRAAVLRARGGEGETGVDIAAVVAEAARDAAQVDARLAATQHIGRGRSATK